jgi:hypothetical protein
MSEQENINRIRKTALERIERNERNYKLAFFGAALFETLFIATFLLLMDRFNRMHTLLLIATVANYTILALGLVALGAHFNRISLRILKAIETLETRSTK